MTYILHLDTSAHLCTVMLSENGTPVYHETLEDSKAQSSRINGMIANVLEKAGIQISALAAVSVCNGPGSYTGLRVGLATAKGICFALNIPLILHNKLELIGSDFTHIPNRAVVLKAREGEIFAAIYQDNKLITEPSHYFLDEFNNLLKDREGLCIICNDRSVGPEDALSTIFIDESGTFSNENWANTAFRAWENKDFADLAYSEPYYMKAAFTTQAKK